MIWRAFLAVVGVWLLGFIWFAMALPQPLDPQYQTDAVIVPTGGAGRIARGLDIIEAGGAQELFVSGVDPEVKPDEFAEEFAVPPERMECCVTLGFRAVDTRSNAVEAADWLDDHGFKTVRLVTTDWHMRRAANEFRAALPEGVELVEDGVRSTTSLSTLFLEYNKLLASRAAKHLFS
ncbi:YdcF family protein [Qipengyuania atrilutea]|uniref:YdcF family protein n=1 Tax=Qipengyuania atrilutea TaxID=2744473 RepID=A0A850H5X9_9SPHN|nr:YdcF family protein [Actirhodobacter atriluteus]NVD46076.1 YdcF family protein [Actirhodobacter atriluteus]